MKKNLVFTQKKAGDTRLAELKKLNDALARAKSNDERKAEKGLHSSKD